MIRYLKVKINKAKGKLREKIITILLISLEDITFSP
jgi:hypothetical protein